MEGGLPDQTAYPWRRPTYGTPLLALCPASSKGQS